MAQYHVADVLWETGVGALLMFGRWTLLAVALTAVVYLYFRLQARSGTPQRYSWR